MQESLGSSHLNSVIINEMLVIYSKSSGDVHNYPKLSTKSFLGIPTFFIKTPSQITTFTLTFLSYL